MYPSDTMSRIIGGKRYTVGTAKKLAEGETTGRAAFLYKTPRGAFFRVDLTIWEGERDMITPLSRDEAMEMWEQCPDEGKWVNYEKAFDVVVKEA